VITLTPNDFVPVDHFGLLWRFDASRCDPGDSAQIFADVRVLKPEAIAALWPHADDPALPLYDGRRTPDIRINAHAESEDSSNVVREALRTLPIPGERRVIVHWEHDTAIETRWTTFCEHWDDFCYPSSDDVTVVPMDRSWVLCYFHWEEFMFAASETAP